MNFRSTDRRRLSVLRANLERLLHALGKDLRRESPVVALKSRRIKRRARTNRHPSRVVAIPDRCPRCIQITSAPAAAARNRLRTG